MILALWALIVLSILFILRLLFKAYSRANAESDISAIDESSKVMADITRTYERQVELLDVQRENGEITQDEYADLKTELDRQLIQDYQLHEKPKRQTSTGNALVSIFISLIVLSVFAGYFYWQWNDEEQQWLATKSANQAIITESIENSHTPVAEVFEDRQSYQNFLRVLHAQVLAEEFENINTLRVLANTYLEGQIFDMAAPLYERLLEDPAQADYNTRLSYVRSEMMANDGRLSPKTAPQLERLFSEDPNNEVLYLLGLGAFNTGNYQISLTSWRPVLESFEPGSEQYNSLQALINEAQQNLADSGRVPTDQAEADTQTETEAPQLTARLEPAEVTANGGFVDGLSLDGELPPQPDLNFQLPVSVRIAEAVKSHIIDKMNVAVSLPQLVIYARGTEMPMPIAVNRQPITAAEITGENSAIDISLQEQNSLTPARLLSQQDNIVLGARIAFTEDMRAQTDDVQSIELDIDLSNGVPESLDLVIDEVIGE